MQRRFACVDCQVTYRPLNPEKPVYVANEDAAWSGYWYPVPNRCELCSLARGLDCWAEFKLSQKKT